jgi:hypothetical protein
MDSEAFDTFETVDVREMDLDELDDVVGGIDNCHPISP